MKESRMLCFLLLTCCVVWSFVDVDVLSVWLKNTCRAMKQSCSIVQIGKDIKQIAMSFNV